MKVAIYPGSFDPITVGHMDIVERATVLFDKVIISVAETDMKNPLFSSEERLDLVSSIYANNEKIEVVAFKKKLTVDLARENNACAIIRGLRAVSDFEHEFQLATMNRALAPDIESIFLTPSLRKNHGTSRRKKISETCPRVSTPSEFATPISFRKPLAD